MHEATFLGIGVTAWIAVFTLGILIAAAVQACIYWVMLSTTKAIERAWVSLETLDIEIGHNNRRVIAVGLKNSGRTTATILSANVTVRGTIPTGTLLGDFATLIWPTLISKCGPPATLTAPCRSQRDRGGLVGQESPRGVVRRDSTGVSVRHRDD